MNRILRFSLAAIAALVLALTTLTTLTDPVTAGPETSSSQAAADRTDHALSPAAVRDLQQEANRLRQENRAYAAMLQASQAANRELAVEKEKYWDASAHYFAMWSELAQKQDPD